MLSLDSTDLRILKALQEDGSRTVSQVAERAGISQSPCSRRIQSLIENGVILGKSIELDRRKLGFDLIIETRIKLEAHDRASLDRFKAAAVNIPEVQSIYMMLGEFDFRLQSVVRDISNYQALLQDRLSALPNIKEMQSSVILETVKLTSALPL